MNAPAAPRRGALGASCLALACLLLGWALSRPAPDPEPPTRPTPTGPDAVARGAYLATLGHCAGCHTAPGGRPYAGGRPLETPYGRVVPGNLTPDPQTGLGGWTSDDFWRALHHGRGRDGRRLLPVFPYPNYTHVRRADSDALFAYLQSLPPVAQAAPPHALRFPYNTQAALAVWQALYFRAAPPAPDDADPLARGAYLVQGLGHCGACHSPRNALGASASALSGGVMPGEGWWAPSLHPIQGLGTRADDLATLMRTGMNRQGSVTGPMARVVYGSLQHWRREDLDAVARYLASLPPTPAPQAAPEASSERLRPRGAELYAQRCADCHGAQGQGVPGVYPPLAGNPSVLQPDPRNLLRLLQHGGFAPATAGNPRPYGMGPQGLTEAEAAAVLTHLRRSWGHQAEGVDEVAVVRAW